jgi:hypothetical protein
MIPLGLRASELRALQATLIKTHRLHIDIELMTLSHSHIGILTNYLLDGQIDVDNTQDVTRQLSMTLMDDRHHLPFDTDSPADTALFMDRMIRVVYKVLVGGSWVGIPVFTGPITGLQRNGPQVIVTAQSKEVLAMGNVWPSITLHKNLRKTDAITRLLKEAGEDNRHLYIHDLPSKLPHHMSLHHTQRYWMLARSLARGMNRQLYYDGGGICRLRSYPGVVYTFRDTTNVIGDPQITYGAGTANTVIVTGATPKGHKTPITATAVAPAAHPLSPWRLGRNGQARHILLDGAPIDVPTIKHQGEADAYAKRRLDDALMQQVDVQFDVVPGCVALLDHGDLCHLTTEHMTVAFRLSKFSLPLRDGESASVGYHKNVSLRRYSSRRHHRPVRKHRRHHH